jgi:hypothetical protein
MKILNAGEQEKRHRLIILTDMENEQDDSQTMVRLLMYSNEIDIEGLIAVTSTCLKDAVYPESIRDRVIAYGTVRDNLRRHADRWPTQEQLASKIGHGPVAYGMSGVGDDKSTDGTELIIAALRSEDQRPLYFAVNAGVSALAQALWDLRRSLDRRELRRLVRKIRVYDNTGQDDAGVWICSQFPEIFYMRSQSQVTGLYGPDAPILRAVQNATGNAPFVDWSTLREGTHPQWLGPNPFGDLSMYRWTERHIRTRHGILGALYPHRIMGEMHQLRFLEGGGVTSWYALVNKGLSDPEQITWGGWGGRFSDRKEVVLSRFRDIREQEARLPEVEMYPEAADAWHDEQGLLHHHVYAPLWRWRQAFTNEFQARMDWCVSDPAGANHNPVAAFHGDTNRTIVHIAAEPGEAVPLDASASSDPDGDALSFRWYTYPEAGTYPGSIEIEDADTARASMRAPDDAEGCQIHVIVEVTDDSPIVRLTSYRRIVLCVA